jgi:hypothetical protein
MLLERGGDSTALLGAAAADYEQMGVPRHAELCGALLREAASVRRR